MTISRRDLLAASSLLGLAPIGARAAPALPESQGPLSLPNTFVHVLPEAGTGRRYEVWVDLPPSVASASAASAGAALLPAVFVTDAPYAFPMVRALRHRVGQQGRNIADFVLIGLAAPSDESPVEMRSRDYTPSDPRRRASANDYGAPAYGEAPRYLRYVAEQVVPAVTERYRLDPARRVFYGHSYGALFGGLALLERPGLFSHHLLGSPSWWFDRHVMFEREAGYARAHRDLASQVFQYVGGYEAVGKGPRYNRERDLVADMRRFDAALRSRRHRSLRLESRVLAGEDHLTVAPSGATQGLLWALPGRGPYGGG